MNDIVKAWEDAGSPHPYSTFQEGYRAGQAQPIMPPLTDSMRAVIRNENDVYGDEDALPAFLRGQIAAAVEELATKAQPKRRPYNSSGSLSEYGVFPECDAQQPVSGADGVPAIPTQGMTLGQRIAHVGGRENAQGYVEFGSPMAVHALIQHVLRDFHLQGRVSLAPAQQDADKADADPIRAYRKSQPRAGTETLQQLNEVLRYLENEVMKLEAAYGHNFKPYATKKARATVEKLKAAMYTISKRRGEQRVIGRIKLDGNRHPRAVLATGYDENGDQWKEGTPIYAAPQPPPSR